MDPGLYVPPKATTMQKFFIHFEHYNSFIGQFQILHGNEVKMLEIFGQVFSLAFKKASESHPSAISVAFNQISEKGNVASNAFQQVLLKTKNFQSDSEYLQDLYLARVQLKEDMLNFKDIYNDKKGQKINAKENLNQAKAKNNQKQIDKYEEELQRVTAIVDSAERDKQEKAKEYFGFRIRYRKDFILKLNELFVSFFDAKLSGLSRFETFGREIIEIATQLDDTIEIEDPEIHKLQDALDQLSQIEIK
jgi:hypothetical protein